jgi:septin family protein
MIDNPLYRAKKVENHKFREKEDELRKSFTEKVKLEEGRFRQWEQQVNRNGDGENILFLFYFYLLLFISS